MLAVCLYNHLKIGLSGDRLRRRPFFVMLDIVNSPFSTSPVSLARVYSHRPDGRMNLGASAPLQSQFAHSGADGAAEVPQRWVEERLVGVGTYSKAARLGSAGKITGITFTFSGSRALCFGPCNGRPEFLKLEAGEHVQRLAGRVDASRGSPCLVMLQITTSHRREHIFGLSHRTRSCSPFSYSAPWGEEIVAVRLSPTAVYALAVCGVETRQLAALPKSDGSPLKVVQPSSLGGHLRTRLFEDDIATRRQLNDAASRLMHVMQTLKTHAGNASHAGAEAALRLPSPPRSGAGGVLAPAGVEGQAVDATDLAQTDEEHGGIGALPRAVTEAVQSIATASEHLKHRHERQTCKVRLGACPRVMQARLHPPEHSLMEMGRAL